MSEPKIIHVDFLERRRKAASDPTPLEAKAREVETAPPLEGEEAAPKRRDPTGDLFTRAEVSRLFGVPESRLRYWEKTGFLPPTAELDGRRLYTFQDLIGVRAAKSLLEQGAPLRRVRRSVDSLRAALPNVIRPLAELRIAADGDRLVVRTERAKWEPMSGQLLLDFDVRDLRDEVVRVLRPEPTDPARRRAAYEAYLEGSRLDEDASTWDSAEAAYRRAIQLDPHLGHAYTNLANLCFRRGQVDDATQLYERALKVDPAQPEAHYNLGYMASERGDFEGAQGCFEAAVASDPAFADAQFNLAMTYSARGRAADAKRHFEIYLSLEPRGEWAEIARRHVRGLGD